MPSAGEDGHWGMAPTTAAPCELPALRLPAGGRLTDVGANLLDDQFAKGAYHGKIAHDPDVGAVIARARAAGVHRMVITAGSVSESKEALAMCEKHDLVGTAGVHPTRVATDLNQDALAELDAFLEAHVPSGRIAAYGECGLDDARLHFSSQEEQDKWLLPQLRLARKHRLPLFLHMRGAEEDEGEHADAPCSAAKRLVEALKASAEEDGGDLLPHGAVTHSFTGTCEDLDLLLSVPGMRIGINGCSLRTEANVRVAARVPLDRLLLETDCPWCEMKATHASRRLLATVGEELGAPQPESVKKEKKDGKPDALVKNRYEPLHIVHVLHAVAAARREFNAGAITGAEAAAAATGVEAHAVHVAQVVEASADALFFARRKRQPLRVQVAPAPCDEPGEPARLHTPTAADVDRAFASALSTERV